jgi:hypothetical protein
MKKQDLELGMYVVTRTKGVGLVVKGLNDNGFDIYNVGTGVYLLKDEHLSDDLTCEKNSDFDIIEVYSDYTLKDKIWDRSAGVITLLPEEEIILKCIDEYEYITRDRNGDLWLWNYKPEKCSNDWKSSGYIGSCCCKFNCYNHLFKFVKWSDSKPRLITSVLKF